MTVPHLSRRVQVHVKREVVGCRDHVRRQLEACPAAGAGNTAARRRATAERREAQTQLEPEEDDGGQQRQQRGQQAARAPQDHLRVQKICNGELSL